MFVLQLFLKTAEGVLVTDACRAGSPTTRNHELTPSGRQDFRR